MAPVSRIAGDLVASVLLFHRAEEGERTDAAGLRSQLLDGIDSFARNASREGLPQDEIDEGRFALAAFADEMIVSSGWHGAPQWNQQPLQSQLFQTHRAGNEFFTRLAALRPDQNVAREMYFLCLAMGFRGQYADAESERQELIRSHFEYLRAAHRARDVATRPRLAPSAYELDIEIHYQHGVGPVGILLRWAAGSALLFGLLWLTLFFVGRGIPTPGS